jgi:hypothetical protein
MYNILVVAPLGKIVNSNDHTIKFAQEDDPTLIADRVSDNGESLSTDDDDDEDAAIHVRILTRYRSIFNVINTRFVFVSALLCI